MRTFLICLYILAAFALDAAHGQTIPAAPIQVVAPHSDSTSAPLPVTVKDEAAAPPAFVQDLVVAIKSLPVLGPIAVKVLNWLTVFFTIISGLCAFLLVVLKSLSGVANIASLAGFAEKIQAFQDSKIIYWLKYFSIFNAKKPNS